MYLKGRITDGGSLKEREIFHLLVHSSNGQNLNWAEARSQELSVVQAPKHFSCLLLLSQVD